MGEYTIRRANPADVDRVWPLFDEIEGERLVLEDASAVEFAESRRSAVVDVLLDDARPVLVAYSGIRAVGYVIPSEDEPPYVSSSWRGLGVDVELDDARRDWRGVPR